MCSLFGSCLHQSPITTTQLQNSRILAIVRAQRPILRRDPLQATWLFHQRSISVHQRSGSAVRSELIAAIFRKFPYRCTKSLVSSSAESQMI